jgi:uncharacterized protein YcfJ
VAGYNVDIAVALKGAEQLGRFNKQIKDVAENIKGANIFLQSFSAGSEGLARSVGNLQRNLGEASTNLRNVALGTKEATIAASQFLKAQDELNKGLIEQQKLLDDVSGATAKKTAADNKNLQEALLRLETKQTRNLEKQFKTREDFQDEFKNEIKKINKQRQDENKLLKANVQQTKNSVAEEIKKKFSIMASQKTRKAAFQQSVREFELENRINKVLQNRQRLQRRRQNLNRATSNALIGGAFPLLFGQGAGASVGGALGGFGGGLLGGQFGFALSLVGTSLGSAVDRFVEGAKKVGEAMNENGKEFDRVQNIIGKEGANKLSAFASSTKTLSKTFGDFILGAQSGVAGLIGATGILNNLISGMQMRIAKAQAQRSSEFKQRVQGLRGQGGQGSKRRNILQQETGRQFDINVQKFANQSADTSFELIQAEIKGLEREGFLHDANTEKMRKALEIRFQHQDIMERLEKAGATISEQESELILGLLKEKQLREDNLNIQKEITNIIANDMGNGIKDLITGAQSFNDVMRNALNNMANAFLNLGIFGNFGGSFERGKGLLGAIFRAEGGPVKGGKSYIVGERGPEMFTPGSSGMITPNHALGGSTNVIVNVDASGSSVEGDEQQGRELGRLISVAVQSELVQQKRPGGLLA